LTAAARTSAYLTCDSRYRHAVPAFDARYDVYPIDHATSGTLFAFGPRARGEQPGDLGYIQVSSLAGAVPAVRRPT